MRDPEELWTILDKEYKKSVRESRVTEKTYSDYIYPGLCHTIDTCMFRVFSPKEVYFMKDKIAEALLKGPRYNYKGKVKNKGPWLFPPKDVNSRYKWIKKQKELSKQSKQTE